MTAAKLPSERKAAPAGRQCLCGCGDSPRNPDADFCRGHEARVMDVLSRLHKETAEPGSRLPEALLARAAADRAFKVGDYDAGQILKLAAAPHSELKPSVRYYPDTQTLLIQNGKSRAEGEHIAKGVMVFYAAETGEELDHDVSALTIEYAETTLKPFVDAILAKYGATPSAPPEPAL